MTEDIQEMIEEKDLNAPRITPEHIEKVIDSAQFYVFPSTTTTICALKLQNGYIVIGESACASPENFDQEVGRAIALKDARSRIWALEGYLLKDKLCQKEK